MNNGTKLLVVAVALALGSPTALTAQSQPPAGPLFAAVWTGGPLDSIYNAEYQRVQAVCAGAGDACHEAELDTTAVRLAPVFASPDAAQPSGWLAARLRARGAWPYASLLFIGVDGTVVPLIDELGDWGYGLTFDLVEANGAWIRPWLLAATDGPWIGPEGGPGLGVVDGPYGLAGRLWQLGPLRAEGARGEVVLPEGVYMVLEVADGTVTLRSELPHDMSCGEPVDSVGPTPNQIFRVDSSDLLDASGRPAVEVAYGRGC